MKSEIHSLKNKLDASEKGRNDAEIRLDQINRDKTRMINLLEGELGRLQERQDTLNSTLDDLNQVEHALRKQV